MMLQGYQCSSYCRCQQHPNILLQDCFLKLYDRSIIFFFMSYIYFRYGVLFSDIFNSSFNAIYRFIYITNCFSQLHVTCIYIYNTDLNNLYILYLDDFFINLYQYQFIFNSQTTNYKDLLDCLKLLIFL